MTDEHTLWYAHSFFLDKSWKKVYRHVQTKHKTLCKKKKSHKELHNGLE